MPPLGLQLELSCLQHLAFGPKELPPVARWTQQVTATARRPTTRSQDSRSSFTGRTQSGDATSVRQNERRQESKEKRETPVVDFSFLLLRASYMRLVTRRPAA